MATMAHAPPWNDARAHRYIFTVYALAVPSLTVNGLLTGNNVRAALESAPVLGQASLTGWYSLNPSVPLD